MTVNGPIPADRLGVTAPHEHALIDIRNQSRGNSAGAAIRVSRENVSQTLADPYVFRDNLVLDDREAAVTEIARFAAAGGAALADVTPEGVGRDPVFLKELSDRTGLHVICSCGWYTPDSVPDDVLREDERGLTGRLIRELTCGIGETGIRPGVIGEIGTGERLGQTEIGILRASARAAQATGAPVMVHLYPWGRTGGEVLDILEDAGLPGNRTCLCHTDVLLDEAYIESLLLRGAYVEFDNFGKEFSLAGFAKDRDRIELAAKLIERGYGDLLLFSCDVCLKSLLTAYGGRGYAHVLENIMPALESRLGRPAGGILTENPKHYFDNKKL